MQCIHCLKAGCQPHLVLQAAALVAERTSSEKGAELPARGREEGKGQVPSKLGSRRSMPLNAEVLKE